jgi:hypothetical protein
MEAFHPIRISRDEMLHCIKNSVVEGNTYLEKHERMLEKMPNARDRSLTALSLARCESRSRECPNLVDEPRTHRDERSQEALCHQCPLCGGPREGNNVGDCCQNLVHDEENNVVNGRLSGRAACFSLSLRWISNYPRPCRTCIALGSRRCGC